MKGMVLQSTDLKIQKRTERVPKTFQKKKHLKAKTRNKQKQKKNLKRKNEKKKTPENKEKILKFMQ